MNFSPDQLLTNLLDEHKPQSILVVGSEKPPAIQHYLDHQNGEQSDERIRVEVLSDTSLLSAIEIRFDFCLITPELIQQNKQSGIELLAGIRNRLCHHIYLFIPLNESGAEIEDWTEKDLFSLGLKRLAQFNAPPSNPAGSNPEESSQEKSNPEKTNNIAPILHCFAYQIESYIKKRDWNNARFWANPEQFGKHWW